MKLSFIRYDSYILIRIATMCSCAPSQTCVLVTRPSRAVTLLHSGTVSILWWCVQNHFKYGNNTFIHCVKEASDGASTDLVRDTRFPFSAAASGKPHELSHIKGNLDQIFLSVSHDDIQPLFSFISAGPCATKLCLSRLCVSFCKLAMKHHIVLTESLTPFKH